MRTHGLDPAQRFEGMRERVEAMREIWSHEEASYQGCHVAFGPIWSWPKPVQRPGPPVLVGGDGATVLDRVLAFGDGWMPNGRVDETVLGSRLEELARRGSKAGRSLSVTLSGGPTDLGLLDRYEHRGVTRCVWWAPAAGAAEVEASLDRYASLMVDYERAG